MSTKTRCQELTQYATSALVYGFAPIPILDKLPKIVGWQQTRINDADPLSLVRKITQFCEMSTPLANNFGIVTGEASGVVVLDIDKANNGVDLWNRSVELNGAFPETFTVATGKGGFHYYWRYDDRTKVLLQTNKVLGYPWDFRTNGGMVIFPGSIHASTGEMYAVVAGYPQNQPHIAEMPEWVYQLLLSNQHLRGHAV